MLNNFMNSAKSFGNNLNSSAMAQKIKNGLTSAKSTNDLLAQFQSLGQGSGWERIQKISEMVAQIMGLGG